MLVKKITYTDYDGVERTEDFYFNLTEAEVIEWLTTSGNYTLDKVLEKLVRAEKVKDIMLIFKDLIYKAYGEKSMDGKRFVKSKEVKDEFMESEAYSVLFMEVISDAKKAAEFLNAIVPANLGKAVDEMMKNPENLPPELRDYAAVVNDKSSNSTEHEQGNVVPMTPMA